MILRKFGTLYLNFDALTSALDLGADSPRALTAFGPKAATRRAVEITLRGQGRSVLVDTDTETPASDLLAFLNSQLPPP